LLDLETLLLQCHAASRIVALCGLAAGRLRFANALTGQLREGIKTSVVSRGRGIADGRPSVHAYLVQGEILFATRWAILEDILGGRGRRGIRLLRYGRDGL
jgi:hypothetical protein